MNAPRERNKNAEPRESTDAFPLTDVLPSVNMLKSDQVNTRTASTGRLWVFCGGSGRLFRRIRHRGAIIHYVSLALFCRFDATHCLSPLVSRPHPEALQTPSRSSDVGRRVLLYCSLSAVSSPPVLCK
ncbi:hypothetical protein E2C01_056909 [Portunus trituberculatus]|uniref:Uncharacterized protein n=1 Tax=Portunus trituberculatus TaxID=210409 RepID=A0A5B7GYZ7_PORTR|nr:hypothetical protein [Portunus trituberculatus]